MDRRRKIAVFLLVIAVLIAVGVPVGLFTPLHITSVRQPISRQAPPLAILAVTPMPTATPRAGLIPQGKPGPILATNAILIDMDTGVILYEKKAEMPVPMASTTKIMTALIAIRAGNLNQIITVGQDAVNEAIANDGSSAGLRASARLTLRDLLYALLLPSGDDAAIAIADGIAGSPHDFVNMMNNEATRLQLYQTHYSNPDGLAYGVHYTTPYDLARLARYAMGIPLFAQIVRTTSYQPPAHSTTMTTPWQTTNEMLTTYRGTLGIKTGWVPKEARGCLVFEARRNGHTLIGVVLNSPDEETRFADARALLDWGFSLPTRSSQA